MNQESPANYSDLIWIIPKRETSKYHLWRTKMRALVAISTVAIFMSPQAAVTQPPTPPSVISTCATCHGPDGVGRDRSIPNLAGQSRDYLVRQLLAFRNGQRQHPTMNFFAVQATREELQQIVDYYTALPKP
jgi:cytochrome c553